MKICQDGHDQVAYDTTTCPICRLKLHHRDAITEIENNHRSEVELLKAEIAALNLQLPPRFKGRGNNWDGYFLEENGLYETREAGVLVSGIHNTTYGRIWIRKGDWFNVTGGVGCWRRFKPMFDVGNPTIRVGDCIAHTEIMTHNRKNGKPARTTKELESI